MILYTNKEAINKESKKSGESLMRGAAALKRREYMP